MSEQVHIPRTLDELTDNLDAVGRLLTAREWERAAIVYAFTDIGGPRNSPQPLPPKVSLRAFAGYGFTGLTTVKSVIRYRRAWRWAMHEQLAGEVGPGDIVVLPDLPFPDWNTSLPEYENIVRQTTQARQGLLNSLEGARKRLEACVVWARRAELTDERVEMVNEVIGDIEDVVARLRDVVNGNEVTRAKARTHDRSWRETR